MSSETTTQNQIKPTLATSKKFCLFYICITTLTILNGLFVMWVLALGSLYYASKLSRREEKDPVHEMMRVHLRTSGMNCIQFSVVALLVSLLLMMATQSVYLNSHAHYFTPILALFILSFVGVQMFNLFRLWKDKPPYPKVAILVTWPYHLLRNVVSHVVHGMRR